MSCHRKVTRIDEIWAVRKDVKFFDSVKSVFTVLLTLQARKADEMSEFPPVRGVAEIFGNSGRLPFELN